MWKVSILILVFTLVTFAGQYVYTAFRHDEFLRYPSKYNSEWKLVNACEQLGFWLGSCIYIFCMETLIEKNFNLMCVMSIMSFGNALMKIWMVISTRFNLAFDYQTLIQYVFILMCDAATMSLWSPNSFVFRVAGSRAPLIMENLVFLLLTKDYIMCIFLPSNGTPLSFFEKISLLKWTLIVLLLLSIIHLFVPGLGNERYLIERKLYELFGFSLLWTSETTGELLDLKNTVDHYMQMSRNGTAQNLLREVLAGNEFHSNTANTSSVDDEFNENRNTTQNTVNRGTVPPPPPFPVNTLCVPSTSRALVSTSNAARVTTGVPPSLHQYPTTSSAALNNKSSVSGNLNFCPSSSQRVITCASQMNSTTVERGTLCNTADVLTETENYMGNMENPVNDVTHIHFEELNENLPMQSYPSRSYARSLLRFYCSRRDPSIPGMNKEVPIEYPTSHTSENNINSLIDRNASGVIPRTNLNKTIQHVQKNFGPVVTALHLRDTHMREALNSTQLSDATEIIEKSNKCLSWHLVGLIVLCVFNELSFVYRHGTYIQVDDVYFWALRGIVYAVGYFFNFMGIGNFSELTQFGITSCMMLLGSLRILFTYTPETKMYLLGFSIFFPPVLTNLLKLYYANLRIYCHPDNEIYFKFQKLFIFNGQYLLWFILLLIDFYAQPVVILVLYFTALLPLLLILYIYLSKLYVLFNTVYRSTDIDLFF